MTGYKGYKDIAADLARRIADGEWGQGGEIWPLPRFMEHYGVAKETIRQALATVEDQGLITIRYGHRAKVRSRTPIRIPLSRYGEVLAPGGDKGPWETACAAQGVDGRMDLVRVEHIRATAELAESFGVALRSKVVLRVRRAWVGDEVVQIQHAWYPGDLAAMAEALAGSTKIRGGVLAKLIEAGIQPLLADETVTSGFPSPDETEELSIGSRVPVMRIRRVTTDEAGRVIEIVRIVAPADRVELAYDRLPLRADTV